MVLFRAAFIFATLLSTSVIAAPASEKKFPLPPSGVVRVAFVVSDHTTLIDVAGPMSVLDNVDSPGKTGFQTFTVSETRAPVKMGSLEVIPDYTFDTAPDADIVIVGAQRGNNEHYLNYLRHMAARKKIVMSVCVGVTDLALAGLLDGLEATTHHNYVEQLQHQFPKVRFLPDQPYVHSASRIYTAGGETSGMELAFHIIELYFDHDVAVKTARFMDYRVPNWQR